jgi:hypothetical protein
MICKNETMTSFTLSLTFDHPTKHMYTLVTVKNKIKNIFWNRVFISGASSCVSAVMIGIGIAFAACRIGIACVDPRGWNCCSARAISCAFWAALSTYFCPAMGTGTGILRVKQTNWPNGLLCFVFTFLIKYQAPHRYPF